MKRKALSLLLTLVLCLGLAAPAMAAYEVKSDKCTYELSNDPIGTVEYNFRNWDVEYQRTVYIVPDNTTVTSETVPNGRMIYYIYDPCYSETGYGGWMQEGEPFVVKPYEELSEPSLGYEEIVSYIYNIKSEDMDWDEFGKPEMPGSMDDGIYVVAASAATALGIAVGTTPTTPEIPTTTTPTTPATGFTDVKASDYFATPVAWAIEKEITNGTGDNRFSPGQNCTNAQILTFLWRAYGKPEPTISNPFTNTIPEAYTKAAIWAYEKGMVSGTTFDVDVPCTRAMAVTYMWQAVGSPATATTATFTDVPASASYTQAVAWAVENQITDGTNPEGTTFSPNEICNRGQIVTFLHRNLAR